MLLRRSGKCGVCQIPCTESKEVAENTQLFLIEGANKIQPDMVSQITEWRDTPMYCKDHQQ